jgi:hypothetical protein
MDEIILREFYVSKLSITLMTLHYRELKIKYSNIMRK